ncbi:MAG: toprim domain-containing protein [Promethearchaeota archaeon]
MKQTNLDRFRREKLAEFFDELVGTDIPIVVEGKRDRRALVTGGVEPSRIIMLHGHSLLEVEEFLENFDEVIMLLDLDKEGEFLLNKLRSYLQAHKVKVNMRYSELIYRIFDGHLTCIEHLRRYLI